jgi:hypothetical protein
MPISASRITFYFFKLFQDASNLFNFNIFDWIYPKQLQLSWLKSFTVEINKSSHLGLLTRVETFFVFDSSPRKLRLESELITRLVTTLV